jgi:shikimate dehydrogenase
VTRPPAGAPWPTAATRPVVLLGWPARHSLSPVMHNAAFAEQGIDLVYLAVPTPPDHLRAVVDVLGTMGAVGANVTVPHKRAVTAACDTLTDEARLVGAVNTLVWTTDGLLGDNTDASGLVDALRAEVALRADDEVVVLGTGGAARAAAVAIGRLGCGLAVAGRRADAAGELAELGVRAGARAGRGVDLEHADALADAVAAAKVVINATPLGMDGEHLPGPFHALAAGQVAYDLVYHPPETPFLRDALSVGAQAHNGIGMLIAQAAASYRRWTGHDAPTATMSAAAVGALAGADRAPGKT